MENKHTNTPHLSADQIQKIMEYRQRENHFGNLIGMTIAEASDGYARGELKIRPEHLNPLGTVHGGCLYTLADSIGGTASATRGTITPTVSSDMHFLNPAKDTDKLICEAREIKRGRTISVYAIEIRSDAGKLIADGTFTYFNVGKELIPTDQN